jgi:hypothetical protein
LGSLIFVEAYLAWSTMIIAIDLVVLYALTVHGRELRSSRV